ncbi:MAG: sigma-70 family RNA polymerase sigma factor [Myxococcota bacterium]|nr:sigma-70 family RNA polymerase sigma factor [Myxococcota bacterium]
MTLAASCIIGGREHDPAELDTATLEGCRAGDPGALRLFVTCYEQRVFAFLSRTLGAGPHVEDLAQEVFIRACRALPRFDGAGSARLSTWLFTIARRLAIDARRKRGDPTTALDGDVVLSRDTPETERRRMEIGRALEWAAAELSDEQRDVFVLAEFHDLDMKEIGGVLGIPENTAKTRLFRARERLRVLLRGVWEDT